MTKLNKIRQDWAISKNTKIKVVRSASHSDFLNLLVWIRNQGYTTKKAEEDWHREDVLLAPYAVSSMDREKNKPISPRGNGSGQASIFQNFQQDFEIFWTCNKRQYPKVHPHYVACQNTTICSLAARRMVRICIKKSAQIRTLPIWVSNARYFQAERQNEVYFHRKWFFISFLLVNQS